MRNAHPRHRALVTSVLLLCGGSLVARAAPAPEGDDFPPFDKVTEGLTKVVSTTDGEAPLYDLYTDEKTGKCLAVLSPAFASQMLMIAPTVSGGDPEAGVMGGTFYVKWRRFDKKLALIAPDLSVRTDGDKQAKDSVEHLWTDRVVLSVPIVTMQGPRPVIDFGALATQQAKKFFGPGMGYGPGFRALDPSLATLTKAKAFPENIVVEYEAPREDGRLIRVTYNVAKLEGSPGYQPRKADPRVGYFYDWHLDYARTGSQELADRYITRWNIQKADASLKTSPPKQPVIWYIEHTTPIKYRRYVKQGIELWNDAFEDIGIVGALEVYQQDSSTGAHMDKDPEDARYNFFRWNMSDQGYAIGPSRTNPMTGEILDADVVWNQGLTRSVKNMLGNLSDDLSEEAFDAETLAWFMEHPEWDPRVRMAPGARRHQMELQRALDLETAATVPLESDRHPWTMATNDPANTACRIGNRLSMDISLASAAFAVGLLTVDEEEEGEEDGEPVDMLDGVPAEFLGPMIRYISAHEVGHCMGLQHNMAASTIRTLEEINSPGFEGPTVGSVMEYAAVNINYGLGEVQGPYATPVLGPYDHWAIAYGYGPESELEKVLARVSEPDLIFLSQAAMGSGKDPRNATWELGKNNLNFCESRLGLAQELRGKLLTDIVEEGESWAVARRRFGSLMGTHVSALFAASNWIGGSYSNYDFKGDPGERAPIEDVPAAEQRRALNLIIDNAFEDDAYGLTADLVRHLGKEHWWDPDGIDELMEDPSFTVHDMVASIQGLGLVLVLNPGTLRRVYDNEFRTQGEDTLTLAEVVSAVTKNVWREVRDKENASSFRRNLQREHVDGLIDLALMDSTTASMRTISQLATQHLRKIDKWAGGAEGKDLDDYMQAHLVDVRARIAKALEATYVVERN